DGRDGAVAPVPLGDPRHVELRGLRVALHRDNPLAVPTQDTVESVERATAALRGAGARVEETTRPTGGHELTLEIWRSYGDAMSADELYGLLRRWDAYRGEWAAFAERYDLVLSPVFPGPARRHGAMHVPGEVEPTSFTTPHSLTGWPAATVRCGS